MNIAPVMCCSVRAVRRLAGKAGRTCRPARPGLQPAALHRLIVISRSSVISCIAYFGPSRPRPLSFTPANGIRSTRLLDDSLMCTTPTWMRRAAVKRRGDVAREDAGGEPELGRVDLRRSPRRACRTESPRRPARRSLRTARASSRVTSIRMVGISSAPRRVPPATSRAPPATASLHPLLGARRLGFADHRTDARSRDRADRRPSACAVAAASFSQERRRAPRRCTNSRCVDVHAWPARRNAEFATRGAARSRSPSSQTMVAAMLPSSSAIGRRPDVALQLLADRGAAGERVEADLLVLRPASGRFRCPAPAPG